MLLVIHSTANPLLASVDSYASAVTTFAIPSESELMAAKKLSIIGSTEAALTKIAQDLQRQLESNPIYRELNLVRKALAEIRSTSSSRKNASTVPEHDAGYPTRLIEPVDRCLH
jgi:hypothetical protein